jgi:hypothetical protein
MLPIMSDQGSDDQRRDALLLRLLKMPPQSRAELAEQVRRAKAKPTRIRGKRASASRLCSDTDQLRPLILAISG